MSFHSTKNVKRAMKAKKCYWCGHYCERGDPRSVHVGVWEGDFYSIVYHPECSAALTAWWQLPGNRRHYYDEGPEEHSMIRGSTEEREYE